MATVQSFSVARYYIKSCNKIFIDYRLDTAAGVEKNQILPPICSSPLVMAYTDAAPTHAALRTGGVFYKFSDPVDPNFTIATGINDKRVITGNITDSVTGVISGIKVTY